jgi:peptidoglycan hydrolase-like protein with peptidoglycan-binding domain
MKTSLLAAAVGAAVLLATPVNAQGQQSVHRPSGQTASERDAQGQGAARLRADEQTVRSMQQRLKDQGHDIAVDGVWGPRTQAALKDYQQRHNMQATGVPDRQTLSSLGVRSDMLGSTGSTGGSAGRPDGAAIGSGGSGGSGDQPSQPTGR